MCVIYIAGVYGTVCIKLINSTYHKGISFSVGNKFPIVFMQFSITFPIAVMLAVVVSSDILVNLDVGIL